MLSSLVLLSVATFPGGTPADLAKSLAESTKSSVLIESGPGRRIEAFEYDPANLDELARSVLKAASLRRAPGLDNAFYHPELPAQHFSLEAVRRLAQDPSRRAGPGGSVEPSAVKDGKVTLHSKPGTGISVRAMGALQAAKPIRIDPFFGELSLSAWVTDLPERDFLTMLAKTVGGTLKATKEAYSIEPNGQEIQRRALATLDQVKRHSGFSKLASLDRAQLGLSQAALTSATPAQIASLFASDDPVRMEVGPSVRAAAMQLIQALMETPAQSAPMFGPPTPRPRVPATDANAGAERFRTLDRRLIGIATLHKGFGVTLELATVGEYGRPGTPMRIP